MLYDVVEVVKGVCRSQRMSKLAVVCQVKPEKHRAESTSKRLSTDAFATLCQLRAEPLMYSQAFPTANYLISLAFH